MSLFSSGPPEVLSRVFQRCNDFADVLALAMCSKRLNSVWLSDKSNILWQVGRTSILSFDEALIAVRATEIVRVASVAAELSPEINIPSLSGTHRKPTLSELKSTLDLRHFVRYIEYQFLHRKNTETSWGRGAKHLLDEAPHLLESWKVGFHRAIYRLFIAGAVLSRAYLAPFFENFVKTDPNAIPEHSEFLSEAIYILENQDGHFDTKITDLPMSEEDLDILNNHPVYNFTPHAGWEQCFGHLGDWLIGGTRKRVLSEQNNNAKSNGDMSGGERADLREVMQLLVMFGQLFDMQGGRGVWGSIEEPYWSKHKLDSNGQCMCYLSRSDEDDNDDDDGNKEDNVEVADDYKPRQGAIQAMRKSSKVNFGSFIYSEDQVSDVKEFDENSCLGFDIDPPTRNFEAPEMPEISTLCELLHCMSDRPNRVNGHPAPHPPLHFFTFLLRKYFGYQFDELAFEMNFPTPVYTNFIRKGKIFAEEVEGEGVEWEGMLTSVHEEQVLTYIQLGWADMEE